MKKNGQNYAWHDSNFQNLDRANNHPANVNDRSQAKPAYSYPLIIFQPNGIARISFSYLEIYSNGQHTLKGVWGCVLTKQEGGVGQKLRTCSTSCMQEGGGVGQKGQNLAYLLCIYTAPIWCGNWIYLASSKVQRFFLSSCDQACSTFDNFLLIFYLCLLCFRTTTWQQMMRKLWTEQSGHWSVKIGIATNELKS